MIKRIAFALLAWLSVGALAPAQAQGISQKVAVCNPSFTNRCMAPDANGAIPITGSLTPAGTQDINVKQVGGNAVTTSLPVNVVSRTFSTVAPAASTAAESCKVLKASAGSLFDASGYVGGAAWIMLFNSVSAPGDGAVTPVTWAYVPVAGSWSISYGSVPASLSTGITVCASSTGPLTKTAYSTNTVFTGRIQ